MRKPPASEQVQVNFRMPADLKARIELAAEQNGRSTTAEIVASLEEKYPAPTPDDRYEEFFEWLSKRDRTEQRRFVLEYLSQANISEADMKKFLEAFGRRRP